MESGESDGDQPRNPSSFSTLHEQGFNFLRNRINLSRLKQAQGNNHHNKTEIMSRRPSMKGMVSNAGLRPVSGLKGGRSETKEKAEGSIYDTAY